MPMTFLKRQPARAQIPQSITSADILTVAEVASLLKICPDTVRSMCDRGELPCRMCGNRRRIPGWLLIEWLHKCGEEERKHNA